MDVFALNGHVSRTVHWLRPFLYGEERFKLGRLKMPRCSYVRFSRHDPLPLRHDQRISASGLGRPILCTPRVIFYSQNVRALRPADAIHPLKLIELDSWTAVVGAGTGGVTIGVALAPVGSERPMIRRGTFASSKTPFRCFAPLFMSGRDLDRSMIGLARQLDGPNIIARREDGDTNPRATTAAAIRGAIEAAAAEFIPKIGGRAGVPLKLRSNRLGRINEF